jgi:uncharacterized protein (TIGR00369 family)
MPEGHPEEGRDAFSELLRTEWLDLEGDEVRARLPVSEDLRQPAGFVHGGVFSTLAEGLASKATHEAVRHDGMVAIGQSIQTTFLRPITEGHLNATGRAQHRGRTTWVWDVEITDDERRVCALARMTVAIRPA